MLVKISMNERGNPPGKLAEAELHFTEGVLAGLKLIGFAIWERRGRDASTANVTFPARQYAVNGERRSFALLRPIGEPAAQDGIRNLILDAYRAHVADATPEAPAPAEGLFEAPAPQTIEDAAPRGRRRSAVR